jgi:signal transduction histidine kinase
VLLKNVASTAKLDHHVRRLNRLASIGTLSASMAHEIKNALVPVRTLVGLLLEQNPGAELASIVNREMARVDAIVTRMLRFAGPAKPTFADVRLHQLLEHCFGLVQHRAEGRQIAFHRDFKAPSDALQGDDYQLEQAFLNLMLNAVESMGEHGSLTVGTESITGEDESLSGNGRHALPFLKVNISDTGAGIAPEHLDSIFDAFFTTKQSGTGLGLAVTRRIIEEHNGVIRVHSRPGQGTTFAVLLPARPAAK